MTFESPVRPIAGKSSRRADGLRRWLLALLCSLTCTSVSAQQQQSATTLNFHDVDLAQIVEVVAAVTGKTIILDPRVRAQVTIISTAALPPAALYETFLSILQVHGFVAVQTGDIIKVIPDANARQVPSSDLPDRVSATSDEFVTQVISVRNVNAAQLVPILRPLMPQQAHLVAYQASNSLIISDRASNVNRMIRIIQRIDQAGDEEIDIVRLENATAADIVRVTNSLFSGPAAQAAEAAAGGAGKVVADDRTNSVLISGEKSQRLRLKALITHLDTPLESGGDTRVRYLDYADAEVLAGKLKEQLQGVTQAATGGAATSPAAMADRSVTIWADAQNNALVVTAPPKIMRSIMTVVDKLDIRRLQVQIEAILVDISTNKAAELGVNWAVGNTDSDSTVPIGTFNQPVGSASIGSIAAAIQDPDTLASTGIPTGLTLGAGRFLDNGTNFALLLRALRGDSSSNILQTPSITTLDNEEAEIKVAQEVPFLTGSYSNSSGTQGGSSNSVNPFQTIQREEVGEILKITPQINNSTSIMLKIEQESSGIAQGTSGAVDLITNKRTISTTVMVDDGGIIVLGGLISDSVIEGENRVPILGAIPIIGELFKTRNGSKGKRNLMVFIRPTILRDAAETAITTNSKYNLLREQQLARRKGRVTLLPGERQPLLPPIEDLSRYADPIGGSAPPTPGTDPTRVSPAQTRPLQEPAEAPAPGPDNAAPAVAPDEPKPRP